MLAVTGDVASPSAPSWMASASGLDRNDMMTNCRLIVLTTVAGAVIIASGAALRGRLPDVPDQRAEVAIAEERPQASSSPPPLMRHEPSDQVTSAHEVGCDAFPGCVAYRGEQAVSLPMYVSWEQLFASYRW